MLVVIFAEKVALQEASRRAFPHIYEEIALQEASRRAFPHIYEENPPIPAVVFFFDDLLGASPGHFCAALTTAADVFRMLDLGGRHPPLQN